MKLSTKKYVYGIIGAFLIIGSIIAFVQEPNAGFVDSGDAESVGYYMGYYTGKILILLVGVYLTYKSLKIRSN